MQCLTRSGSKSFLMESKIGKLRAGWINYFAQGHKQVDLSLGTEIRLGLYHFSDTVKHQQMHYRAGMQAAPADAPQNPDNSSPLPWRNYRKYDHYF